MGTQALNLPVLRGRKNLLGSLSGNSSADTLFSDDLMEVVMGICEGPILGLVDGPASIYLNDTPLVNSQGTPTLGSQLGVNVNSLGATNFGQFDVEVHLGTNPPDIIQPKLGGFGTTTSVGVSLDTNLPVVRSGQQINIDFISFRVVINRLCNINSSSGALSPAAAQFMIEYKPHSATNWNPTFTAASAGTGVALTQSTTSVQIYQGVGVAGQATENNYRESYVQAAQPTTTTLDAVWFNSTSGYEPEVLGTGGWAVPSGLIYTPTSGGYALYQWTEGGVAINAYIGTPGQTPPPGLSATDLWVAVADPTNGGNDQVYIYNTTGWVTNIGWSIPGPTTPGLITVSGQTTSSYVSESRIAVARISEGYDVRVTKISGEDSTSYACDMSFDSFVELVNDPLSFPDLALVYAAIYATDQFSQMPTFTLDLYGKVLKVPSNYNANTKVYTGVWDGTWILAYSNNPAYVAYDLIMNDLYGFNAYFPAVCDPDSAYAFGQHCDAHGFTYNEYITEPRGLEETVDYILATAGGLYVEYGDGFGTILFDSDTDPAVALFTPENVQDGIFTYGRTAIESRRNDFIVSYIDPAMNWIENRRRVTDPASVANYGLNTEPFIAAGCIDETEAIKRARMRLIISTTECTMVDFKVNRVGLYLSPYNVIIIADPGAGTGLSGRIKAIFDPFTVTLRDAIMLEAGFVYQLTFQIPDNNGGYTLWTSNVTTPAGSTMALVVQDALPDLEDQQTFSLGAAGTDGYPKAFRINQIDESDGDPDIVSISATEVNRNKWAYVDGTIALPSTIHTGPVTSAVAPPTNISVTAQTNTPGQLDLLLQWTRSVSPLVRYTQIYVSFNNGPSSLLAEVSSASSYLYTNVLSGHYTFALVAMDFNGLVSPQSIITFAVGGSVRTLLPPTDLTIVDEAIAGTFNRQSPVFRWTASLDPYVYGYTIQITDTATGALIRRETTAATATEWTYFYANNTADGAGAPYRTFTMAVYATDNSDNRSNAITMACHNPVPAAPTNVTISNTNFIVALAFTLDPTPDVAGAAVYASTTMGFTPGPANLFYSGPNSAVYPTVAEGAVLYTAVACFDNFDGTLSPFAYASTLGTGLVNNSVSYVKLVTSLQAAIDSVGTIPAINFNITSLQTNITAINASLTTNGITLLNLASQLAGTTGSGLQTSIQTANTAISVNTTSITQLNAQIAGTSASGLLTTLQTNASATAAVASLVNQLQSQLAGASSSGLLTELQTTATQTQSLAQSISLLTAQMDGTSSSTLLTQLNATASSTQAQVNQISQLQAQLAGASSSNLLTSLTTTANLTQAQTTLITALQSQLNGTSSSGLQTTITTLATTTSANASAITTLNAQMAGTSSSGLQTAINTVATTTSANTSSITTLNAQMAGTSSSGLQTALNTVAASASASASSITTLNAQMGTANTAISTSASAITDLQGNLFGTWNVKIQTQVTTLGASYDVISGFGLAQSGGGGAATSSFIVQASNFSVVPTAAPGSTANTTPVFAIGTVGGIAAVGIHGDMYLDGSITATAISTTSLSAISANIGAITAGTITSADGKMTIDLTNSKITISD